MPHSDPQVCEELTLIKARITTLETQTAEINEGVKELLIAWEQGIGIAKFLKFLFYVIAPLVAGIYWIKDHVKF